MFNKSVAAICLAASLALTSVNPVYAGLESSSRGTSSVNTEYTVGCMKHVESFTTNWQIFTTNSQVTIYNWNMNGNANVYDTCNQNRLVSNSIWADRGHQTLKDGEQKVNVVRSTSTTNDTTLKYQVNVVNGEVKMTNIWVDGVKVN